MLFKIRLVSDEVDGFLREFMIDEDATFLDLNKVILESCGYPDDQMTSFYVCNDEWERMEQITREDMGTSAADEDIFVMADTRLNEFIEEKGQKLEYVFDPFCERSFFLNVKDEETGRHLDKPEVVRTRGNAPVQIAELDSPTIASSVRSSEIDDDGSDLFYGSDSFNDDDFDPEGFEISSNPY